MKINDFAQKVNLKVRSIQDEICKLSPEYASRNTRSSFEEEGSPCRFDTNDSLGNEKTEEDGAISEEEDNFVETYVAQKFKEEVLPL